ncbi:MAG TPA: M1 family metallopeptidase [Solirubrobacterales bacterium]|nr:M1 family metallopeptidase [Solirubrobacterales bacterium]
MRSTRLILLIICLGLAAPAAAGAEPFFPHTGDSRLDVEHYQVSVSYRPETGGIRVRDRIAIRATRTLRRFSLDLNGMRVGAVSVKGEAAPYRRTPGKLVIEPKEPIPAGDRFVVSLHYAGVPKPVVDPDGTLEGWIRTDDGAVALGEPQGTQAWLACNNVPGDKATFVIQVIVPIPLVAISNGRQVQGYLDGRLRRFRWREDSPMSPYLAMLDIGRGQTVKSTIAGRPFWTLIDPRLERRSRPVLAALPEVIRFESGLFGAYPFKAAGSVVDVAPKVGYALETQSRPFYPYVPDLTTVVHETAHQWFGDSVGLKRWPEIWLNEGFATWTEWYYAERHGRRSAQAIFVRLYRVPASNEEFWNPPSAHPGTPKHMFGPSVYIRGAMALQALRVKIGTKPMLRLLHDWAVGHRYGSGTIKEFIDLAEEISRRNLDPFFQRWLYRRGKP